MTELNSLLVKGYAWWTSGQWWSLSCCREAPEFHTDRVCVAQDSDAMSNGAIGQSASDVDSSHSGSDTGCFAMPNLTSRTRVANASQNTHSSETSPASVINPVAHPLFLRGSSVREQPPFLEDAGPSDGWAYSGPPVSSGLNDVLSIAACMEDVYKANDESEAEIDELKRQLADLSRRLSPDVDSPITSDHASAFALLHRGLKVLERHPL
jgi:hypothetical protein